MLKCADNTLYTGITNDISRRVHEHNTSVLGAKYTRARRPVSVAYMHVCADRAEALREEARIKKLPRLKKLALVSGAEYPE
jgi:putative endonuclease